MRHAIELILALYVISFAWFWMLCRLTVTKIEEPPLPESEAKVIPFERGLTLKDSRKTGT